MIPGTHKNPIVNFHNDHITKLTRMWDDENPGFLYIDEDDSGPRKTVKIAAALFGSVFIAPIVAYSVAHRYGSDLMPPMEEIKAFEKNTHF